MVVKANGFPNDWNFIELENKPSDIISNGVNKNKEEYDHGCLFVNILNVFREFTIDSKKLKSIKISQNKIKKYGLKK